MPDQSTAQRVLEQIRDDLIVQRYHFITEVKPDLEITYMNKPFIGILESAFTFIINNLTILLAYSKKS